MNTQKHKDKYTNTNLKTDICLRELIVAYILVTELNSRILNLIQPKPNIA